VAQDFHDTEDVFGFCGIQWWPSNCVGCGSLFEVALGFRV